MFGLKQWKGTILFFILISLITNLEEILANMPSGNLLGRITDENNKPLVNVLITMVDIGGKQQRVVKSSEDGFYYIKSINPASYIIKFQSSGYAEHLVSNVSIHPGKTSILNIKLTVKGIKEVWINQKTLFLEDQDSISKMLVEVENINKIPLIERNMLIGGILFPSSFISKSDERMKPESDVINLKGGSGRNVDITIDGGENSDDIFGGEASILPIGSLKEFTLVANKLPAEYGRASAVINAVTKSVGTSDTASLFFKFRNAMLSKEPFSQEAAGIDELSFNRINLGGSLFKKIRESKTYINTSLEYFRENREILVDTNKIFVDEDGINEIDKNRTQFFIKLSNIINDKQRIAISYSYQKDKDYYDVFSNISPSSWALINYNYHSLLFAHMYNKSEDIVNEALVQFSMYNNKLSPTSDKALMFFPSMVRSGSNPNAPQEAKETKLQVKDEFSFSKIIFKKHHYFKGGLDLISIPRLEIDWGGAIDIPQYTFLRDSLNSPISTILIMGGDPKAENDNIKLGIFFQDDWIINNKLMINAGLRYDVMLNNDIDQSQSSIYKALLENDMYNEEYLQVFKKIPKFKNDLNGIQPRVSFGYDFNGDGKTYVSGGFGRYIEFPYFKGSYLFPTLALSNYYIKYFYFSDEGIINPDGSYWKPGDPLPPSQLGEEKIVRDIGSTEFKLPYTDQINISIEHKLTEHSIIEASYTNSRGRDYYIAFKFNGIDKERSCRRFTDISPYARIWYPGGYYNYNSIDVIFREDFSSKYKFIVSYSISKIEGNMLAASDSYSVASPLICDDCLIDYTNLKSELNKGPLNTDSLHKIKFISFIELPKEINLSLVGKIRSGLPYNNYTIIDINGDGFNYDIPKGYQHVNESRGDWFIQFDLRLSREINYKKFKLGILLEIFNLFNNDNPSRYVGNVDSVNYGKPTIWAGDSNYYEQFLAQLGFSVTF